MRIINVIYVLNKWEVIILSYNYFTVGLKHKKLRVTRAQSKWLLKLVSFPDIIDIVLAINLESSEI